jgi:hypothetical protein
MTVVDKIMSGTNSTCVNTLTYLVLWTFLPLMHRFLFWPPILFTDESCTLSSVYAMSGMGTRSGVSFRPAAFVLQGREAKAEQRRLRDRVWRQWVQLMPSPTRHMMRQTRNDASTRGAQGLQTLPNYCNVWRIHWLERFGVWWSCETVWALLHLLQLQVRLPRHSKFYQVLPVVPLAWWRMAVLPQACCNTWSPWKDGVWGSRAKSSSRGWALYTVEEESKMVIDDVDSEVPTTNSKWNTLSIHFEPESTQERQQCSSLLTAELHLRNLDLTGGLSTCREHLRLVLKT